MPVQSPEYLAAIKAHDQAIARHNVAVAKYRAREIDDSEYLSARAAKGEADEAFDAAFYAEQNK